MARLIAEGETLTPLLASHSSQWRSKVASSFSSSCSHSVRLSSGVARMRRFRPVEVPGERSSPSLFFLSQRLSVVRVAEVNARHHCPEPDPLGMGGQERER